MSNNKIDKENNWQSKSLENLEKDYWPLSINQGPLITKCNGLRKVPLNQLNIEDIRVLISQNIGLKYIIPIALEILKNNIKAEGDLYEGDLLKSVININCDFWQSNLVYKEQLINILKNNNINYESI